MFKLTITNNDGEATAAPIYEPSEDMRRLLLFKYGIDDKQVEFATQITENNPGIPYDLHIQDEQARIIWTARLIKIAPLAIVR